VALSRQTGVYFKVKGLKAPMSKDKSPERNTDLLRQRFNELLAKSGDRGILGVADFTSVYRTLHTVQQDRLRKITQHDFERYMSSGYFISIGIAYHESVIDDIDVRVENEADINRWNNYAMEYNRINAKLDEIAQALAHEYNGIAIPATLSGFAANVEHVTEYFKHTISHRVVAEMAGLGWRGKNGLTINSRFSCAIRFASIMTNVPLCIDEKAESNCGNCTACEDACSFLRNRNVLQDYRENCRRYIINLQKRGLMEEVCGKCILACYRNSLLSTQFALEEANSGQR
jgi:epoxyqueuosine reductase